TDGQSAPYWVVDSTSGAGSAGANPHGNDGNSFFSSGSTGDFFTPTSSIEGPGTWDYSLGIIGTSVAVVAPEPSVVAMGLGACFSLVGYSMAFRRRLASRATAA